MINPFEAVGAVELDIPQWYGVLFATISLARLLCRGVTRLFKRPAQASAVFFLKHFVYPRLLGTKSRFKISRIEVILLIIYAFCNGFCMLFRTSSVKERSSRAALLSVFNLMALLTGTRASLAADLFGVSLRVKASLHKWIALISTIQAFIHMALSLEPVTWNGFQLAGLAVGGPGSYQRQI